MYIVNFAQTHHIEIDDVKPLKRDWDKVKTFLRKFGVVAVEEDPGTTEVFERKTVVSIDATRNSNRWCWEWNDFWKIDYFDEIDLSARNVLAWFRERNYLSTKFRYTTEIKNGYLEVQLKTTRKPIFALQLEK